VSLDPDTTACPQSLDAARRAAGCGIAATEAVIQGTVSSAFALIRPPGHHAEPDRVMGFCFFNNAAIAARHAVHELGLHKVAIVDFDVHHGNGTQSAFYDDPRVLYLSTHQFPFYPGTGGVDETGRGAGAGSTINIPLRIGHGDREYAAIYGALVPRVLEQFGPELIIVSAGLDMMAQDPLGGMGVTAQGVYQIAHALVACADRICDGRIVFVLEGGYDLSALTQGVGACLTAMASDSAGDQAIETLDESALGDARMHLPVYRDLFRI
jgi:acetoin utilization deacetylase AcuC-like enzyme